ncbi:MAG: alpha/beta hydrolase [Acetobacteraceae bacterium]
MSDQQDAFRLHTPAARSSLPPNPDQSGPDQSDPAPPSIPATGGRVLYLDRPDGTRLRAAHWPGGTSQVLLLNGRTEFIERNLETVAALQARGFQVWTLDWRGQGGSTRPLPDPMRNHVHSFDDHLADLDHLVRDHIGTAHPLLMLAHSMGGHLGLRYLAMRPALFRGAVLSAPMIDFRRGPGLSRGAARLLARLACLLPGLPNRYGPGTSRTPLADSPFQDNPLTSCPTRFAHDRAWSRHRPDLLCGGATWGWLRAATASIAEVNRRDFAARLTLPLLIVLAGDERLVDNRAARALAARLQHAHLQHASLIELRNARHELLREADSIRTTFWAAFDRFVATISP